MSLRDDIRSNPACADALARRDCDELARIVSAGRTIIGPIEKKDFAIWCAASGMRAAIEDHASNPASPLRAIALSLKDFLVGPPDAGIDFSEPGNQQSLAAWEAVGAINAEQKAQLLAMGVKPAPVSPFEVAEALFNTDGSEK